MKKKLLIFLLAIALLTMTSCATMLNGSTETISIDSQPQGATVKINGFVRGKTPLRVYLENDSSYTVELEMEGYFPAQAIIKNKVGAGWVILDAFVWGLLGPLVDACTGDWYELQPKALMIPLQQQ